MPDAPDPKPCATRLGWRVRERAVPFAGRVNRLRVDRIEVPGRGEFTYSYLERGESVIIVPVLADGRVVLIRQYRYAVDARCVELPAGCGADAGGIPLEELCRKELREEIGATAERVEPMGWFYSSSSLSDEVCHVYLATGCRLAGDAEPEPGESIERLVVPAVEALRLARSGEIKTGTCALALLLCEERLRGLS